MGHMRSGVYWRARFGWAVTVVGAVLTAGGCTSASSEPGRGSAVTFSPVATVQDIMLSMVDPDADVVWESVATIVTHEGTEERRPRTDEDWARVRHGAVRLLEATNLLLIEGRPVAAPGMESENPDIELHPEQIEALIMKDRATWNRLVGGLFDVAQVMLNAVDAKDPDMLFDNGGPLDRACENCHQKYWYPDAIAHPPVPGPAPVAGAPGPSTGTGTGTIQGAVHLSGKLPGNSVIRMGVDPACVQLTTGRQMVQEAVLTAPDGGLANVFLQLEGTFAQTPVPVELVVVDQRDCIFAPRVVGARVGQSLQFMNSDDLFHNVHSLTATTNTFNVGQPLKGMVYETRLEKEDGMLQIKCDRHRWMTEYVGVVSHPYFDVSDRTGTFSIENVPAGTHTIQAWHEVYGTLTQTVTVEAGAVTSADFVYPEATK